MPDFLSCKLIIWTTLSNADKGNLKKWTEICALCVLLLYMFVNYGGLVVLGRGIQQISYEKLVQITQVIFQLKKIWSPNPILLEKLPGSSPLFYQKPKVIEKILIRCQQEKCGVKMTKLGKTYKNVSEYFAVLNLNQ